MLEHHPFGLAGGAGCVDHIGQIRCCYTSSRVVRRSSGINRLVIQQHGVRPGIAQHILKMGLGQQHRRAGVFEHETESLARIRRVQRQIRSTGFHHGKQAHHHVNTALHTQRHRNIRPDPEAEEVKGQPVGPFVELAVADIAVTEHQGRGVGVLLHPGFYCLMDTQLIRVRAGSVIPVLQQPLSLNCR